MPDKNSKNIPNRFSQRFQKSLLFYSAFGIIFLCTVVALIGLFPFYHNLNKRETEKLLFTLKQKSNIVEEYLEKQREVTRQITSRTRIRSYLKDYNNGKIREVDLVTFTAPKLIDGMNNSKDVVGVTRFDKNDRPVVEVGMSIPKEHWRIPNERHQYILVHGPFYIKGESYLTVAAAILDRTTERVGTDIVLFSLSHLKQVVEDYSGLGETGEVVLGDEIEEGVQLFFPLRKEKGTPARVLPKDSCLGSALIKASANDSGIIDGKSRGCPLKIAYSPIRGNKWGIAVKVDRAEFYLPIRRHVYMIGGIIAFIILIGTLGLSFLIRSLAGKVVMHTDELNREVETKTKDLQEEVDRRKRTEEQIQSLYELSKRMAYITSKEKLLPWIAEQAASLINAEVCNYRIREGNYLIPGGGYGGGEELMKKEKLKIGESLAGMVAEEKKPFIVEDIIKDSRYLKEHKEIAKKLGLVSYLGVPMMVRNEVKGVLNLLTKRRREFNQVEIELLSSFADMAAIAIENARLVSDLEEEILFRKKAEQSITESLREKELLLMEVHHRVKNNMQVISSLLDLQSSSLGDERLEEILYQCQTRIRSMALVHEKIYQAREFANIDVKDYIKTLAESLYDSFAVDREKIAMNVDVQDFYLDLDTAVPVGLIINELVTNSFKYAFNGRGSGEVRVSLRSMDEEELELIVSDNGVGLPEGFRIEDSQSLGLKIVSLLGKKQLRGKIEIKNNGGAEFRLILKRMKPKRRTP